MNTKQQKESAVKSLWDAMVILAHRAIQEHGTCSLSDKSIIWAADTIAQQAAELTTVKLHEEELLEENRAFIKQIEELEDENAHQLRYMQFIEETLNETGALIESTVINPAEGE
jgi:hypothetical protein